MFTARSATLPLALFTLVFFCGTLFLPVFSRIVEIPSTLDFKRFLLIGAMITSVLTLSLAKQLRYTPISLKTSLVLLVFFSCGLISTWWSPYPYWSLVDLANYGFLLLAFFLLNICITSCTPSVVCRWMFWVTCLFSIIFFCEYFAKFAVMMFESKRVGTSSLIAGFENPRMFNQLQVMLVPLLLQPFFLPSSLNKKYLAMALMAGHWMVSFSNRSQRCSACANSSIWFGSSILHQRTTQDNAKNICAEPVYRAFVMVNCFGSYTFGFCWQLTLGSADRQFRTTRNVAVSLATASIQPVVWQRPDEFCLGAAHHAGFSAST